MRCLEVDDGRSDAASTVPDPEVSEVAITLAVRAGLVVGPSRFG